MLSDVLLHPGMRLSVEQGNRFLEKLLPVLGGQWLIRRTKLLLPLWRLIWCAILLNEFLPSDNARRIFSIGEVERREDLLLKQLFKAQQMLENTTYAPLV